ncbi:MAG: hypothetical protein ALECFALPRED_009189 [Alectoria fallacina]|uniref:Uncharacterized protein n=1 Tax=Alectoria fallacina TaxID=1903189 RepID=A0A8H3IHL0_9LECA|nr:MAG: hypothetical protein ALECFALPRED_009189 [Alectoria fallacina]
MVLYARRRKDAIRRIESSPPIFFPYVQCMCDLTNTGGESPLPKEWFVPLLHENGETSEHLPKCPQLRTGRSKTTKKRKSPGGPASYLDLEGGEAVNPKAGSRKENAWYQRKEAKTIRHAASRAEAMRAAYRDLDPLAKFYCCDTLSGSEDEAASEETGTMRQVQIDKSITFHNPICLKGRFDHVTPRKPPPSPPKPTPYIDLEEEEKTAEVRKKRKYTRRQPKAAKRLREIPEPNTRVEAGRTIFNAYAECSCDLDDTIDYSLTSLWQVAHEDGTKSHHLATCAKLVTLAQAPRKTRKTPAKSAAYFDLEGEEEERVDGLASPPAKHYNPRTIASDFLRAIGEHPYLPPLNAHMEGIFTKVKIRAPK